MTLRDRALAMAGVRLMGAEFQRVARMLPDARRTAVLAAVESLGKTDGGQLAEDLQRLRKRQARHVNRLARKSFGAAWDQLDPRFAQSVLLHGYEQNH
jgi:hypothetical protein